MSDTTQPRNLRALIKGTGEFTFWPGLTSWANRNNVGAHDLGNVQVTGFKPEVEVLEHEGSYGGEKLVDLTVAIKGKLSYTVKFDELGRGNAKLMLGGADASDITQSALTAQVIDTLGFTANPAVINRWYDLLYSAVNVFEVTTLNIATVAAQDCTADATTDAITDVAHGLANGQRVIIDAATMPAGLIKNSVYFLVNKADDTFQLALTAGGSVVNFTANGTTVTYRTVLIANTDFVKDTRLGRVRFLTAQTADVYPVVTSTAIVEGDSANLRGMTPLNGLISEGYGRIILKDPRLATRPAFKHEGFKCSVRAETGGDFDGKKIAEFDLNIAVDASEVGTMYWGEK